MHDANFNVTGLVNTSGTVVERYIYDPYGAPTVIDDDWSSDDNGLSDVSWVYLHQGGRYDTVTGMYHFRHRDYDPVLGRWVQQDPLGYVDGKNVYQYVQGRPLSMQDPSGTMTDAQQQQQWRSMWLLWSWQQNKPNPYDCKAPLVLHTMWVEKGYNSLCDCINGERNKNSTGLPGTVVGGASGTVGTLVGGTVGTAISIPGYGLGIFELGLAWEAWRYCSLYWYTQDCPRIPGPPPDKVNIGPR